MSEIPDDLIYTEEHEWGKVIDGELRYGITAHAQDELGDIVYVELPDEGEEVEKGEVMGVIESVKAVSDIYAPISGRVTEVNRKLEANPELINEDPYGEGWIVQIEIEDESELDSLINPEEYEETID
ncbi:MAG: glycine cleavage system protein GcvH [Candidatus Thermoplasmatota archaeon]|nr:glycine cleavage system protein GcvH [Candidatus Thermoplasmatota archaeon]